MLEVSAALVISIDGEEIAICAAGSDIVAEIRNPRRLLRQAGSFARGYGLARTAAARLNEHGLTLTLARNGQAFATIGAGAKTSVLARIGGLNHIALVPRKKKR